MIIRPSFGISHRCVLLLVAAAALALPACQSALTSDYSQSNSDAYYQSLVARQIAGTIYGDRALADGSIPTRIGGIKEIARVDSPGPDAASPAGPPATDPASNYPKPTPNPSINYASQIGLASATLHTPENSVGLSLQDAIARTVQHSLAIKVEAYNPAIKESLVIEAEASTFDPTFFINSQWSVNDDPSISNPNFANGQTWANTFGVKRVLPTGTQIQATAGQTMRDINIAGIQPSGLVQAPNPLASWSTNFNLTLTQPTLRGFGDAVNSANIYLAQRDLRISQSVFRQKVMSTVADVEDAYWNLVLARTNVEVDERLVVASEQTYADVYARIPIDATTASVNQALSALISRRIDLLQKQATFRQASDKLKTLINDPDMDINSNVLINPTDRPVTAAPTYDLLDCIDTSLRQRPEMQQARLQLERADIVLTVARNDVLPKLDLTMAVQTNGLDAGLDESLTRNINPMSNVDFTVGIKFEMPIGDRQALSALNRHMNERRQAIVQMIDVAQQISQNVKDDLRQVYANYESIDLSDQQRVAAAGEFQGIIDIENIRQRTPEFLQLKLDSQGRLAAAEQQLTQVIITYNLAVMRLEQAQGTLLEYDRISLDKAPKPAANEYLDALKAPGSTKLGK